MREKLQSEIEPQGPEYDIMSKHKSKQAKSKRHRTPLNKHAQRGKTLLPPFLDKVPRISPTSWMDDRLPEMIWAILIRVACDQDLGLSFFRRILNFIGQHPRKTELGDLRLTKIAQMEAGLRGELIRFIAGPPPVRLALRNLLIFSSLPAREVWEEEIGPGDPNVEILYRAVGSTLWHQSQESTDCRWLRVMAQVVSGHFRAPPEVIEQWCGYPNEGDQHTVRPSIRAAEMAAFEPQDLTWPKAFWREAWEHTPCMGLNDDRTFVEFTVSVTRGHLLDVRERLEAHWKGSHITTSIDAKHDGVFGMAFYSLELLHELLGIGIGTGILGRLGLRTILEIRLNLKFLLDRNEDALWKTWRKYGAGQAKLSALKFDGMVEAPRHINIENLEKIANEDMWEEFVAIELAGWNGLDLRRLSEKINLKEAYDRFYGWTSGYCHGMWGPIRESCFKTCSNPLHRLHRYPESNSLPDVIEDAVELVDHILTDLDQAYPSFPFRLRDQSPFSVKGGAG